jgi:hypothetical protein
MDDVVEELDRWLAAWRPTAGPNDVVVRARDEIVNLREANTKMDAFLRAPVPEWVKKHHPEIRAEALEEAARVCDENAVIHPPSGAGCRASARAIRALKERT